MTEEETYVMVNKTTDKQVDLQICLSHSETEAMTRSIAYMDHIMN